MASLTWTVSSRAWVQEIYDYFAIDNVKAAKATAKGIYDRAQVLKQFPRIGARYESNIDREIRILLYGHYRIIYRIITDDDIHILGVFHGAMDIERLLS